MGQYYTVVQGDCLATIAKQYGFVNWRKIYDAAQNTTLRAKRPNPNVIFPGDIVFIPDFQTRPGPSDSTGLDHKLVLAASHWILRIEMRICHVKHVGSVPYTLTLANGDSISKHTSPSGMIEVPIPADVRSATLEIMDNEFDLNIGDLDPVSRISGVQQRLINLGFMQGAANGVVGMATASAVRAFQYTQPSLEPTGKIDDDTRRCLLKVHDNDERVTSAEESMALTEPTDDEAEVDA